MERMKGEDILCVAIGALRGSFFQMVFLGKANCDKHAAIDRCLKHEGASDIPKATGSTGEVFSMGSIPPSPRPRRQCVA